MAALIGTYGALLLLPCSLVLVVSTVSAWEPRLENTERPSGGFGALRPL